MPAGNVSSIYTNPMAIVTWAMNRATSINTIGSVPQRAGHGGATVQGYWSAGRGGQLVCAGINHMAFYLRFERDGVDLYPLIRQVAAEGREPAGERRPV